MITPKSSNTSNIIKKSEVSTNYNHTNSNNKSSKTRDSGFDWAFTTFNKVQNLPTHQSYHDLSNKVKNENVGFLFENVREVDCNS